MDMASSTSYYHNLKQLSIKYAGKWVVFYARISSGNGNVSSKWTKSESAYQLPYVKLSTPTVVSGEAEKTAEVEVTNTPNVPGTVKQWNVKHTTLLWDSVDCADVYDVTLNGKVADQEGTGKTDLTGRIRIQENVTADESEYRWYSILRREQSGIRFHLAVRESPDGAERLTVTVLWSDKLQ